MNHFTEKELQTIWGSLIQSAVNNGSRQEVKLSELVEELKSLPGDDFDKRRKLRLYMLDDISKANEYIDSIVDIARRIKKMLPE